MTQPPLASMRRRLRQATALSSAGPAASLAALLLLTPLPAQGQASPAPNPVTPVDGGGTRLDYGANGVPVVKIAAPDAKGTSYNRYDRFDIDGRGVVLNNSDRIIQSRLAGYIDGNGALKASGGASLIINEVVGAAPSRLGGYMEVAGRTADVILANPYGISCDGCGFVNAARVTLAAATPLVDAGTVNGFRVGTGTINVLGRGLDATRARLELFARAVTINAGLYADTVTASVGAGEINRDGDVVVTGRRNPTAADQPAFGLDVAALGGMYARSIRLIGTEAGLGVNVSGELAGMEQGVNLSADGRVTIGGIVTARTELGIDAGGAIDVGGQLYAEGRTTLRGGTLIGSGLIGSGGDLAVTAGSVTRGGTLAAGLARDGRLTQPGALTLDVAGATTLTGRTLAQGALTLNAGSLRNSGLLSGGVATLRTGSLDNAGGVIDATGPLDVRATAIGNVGGAIQSGAALTVVGSSLANERGAVLALGGERLTLGVTGAIAGADGQIGGNGEVTVTAGSLSLSGTSGSVTATRTLTIATTGDLTTGGTALVAGGGSSDLTVGRSAGIASGAIQSSGALSLKAGSLTIGSSGQVSGATATLTTAGTLANAGLIASAGRVGIGAGSVTNGGTISGDGGISLTTAGGLSHNGLVASKAAIAIDAGALTSTGGIVQAAGPLDVTAGSIALERASLTAVGSGPLSVTSRGALSATDTRLGGNGDMTVTSATIALTRSRVTAIGALGVQATAGDLALADASTLENGGDLTLRASGTLAHATDIVGRGANLTLSASRIDNRGGGILHLGTGTLAITGTSGVDNAAGRIATNGALALDAATLANDGGRITAMGPATVVVGGGVGNTGGLIASVGGLTLRAETVRNTGGTMAAAGRVDARLASLDGGTLVATGPAGQLELDVRGAVTGSAMIGASSDATIAAGSFALTSDARLSAGATLSAQARDGDLSLGGGRSEAARVALTATRSILTGTGGLVQSTGAMTLDAGDAIVTGGGRVASADALTARAATIDNRNGLLVSGVAGSTLTAGGLLNDRGTLGGDGAVTIAAASFDNGAGTLAAGSDLSLSATTLSNAAGGQIWAERDARVAVQGTLANRGSVAANRDLVLTAGTLDGGTGAGAGTLAGGRLLSIASGGGSTGRLVAPNALTLGVAGDLTNAAGDTISTPGALTLNIGGSLANAGRVEGGAVAITTGGAFANQAGGSIVAGEIALVAGTSLTNQGLINGGGVTLRGGEIANGGAIYGDRVSLFGTNGISNAGGNAVIATRGGLLQLSSGGSIVNRDGALLYSLGNLAVTGASGSGRAGALENLSADIQAQGDIAVAAARVVNARATFATEEALLSSRDVEESDRRDREHRTVTQYVETVTETRVTADSDASRIIGGTIRIDAEGVANRLSTISASGDLSLGAAAVSNEAFTGYNTTRQVGTIEDQKRNCFLFFCGGWDTRSTTPLDTTNAQAIFTVPSTITAGGTLTIDAVTIENITRVPGGGAADIFAARATPGTVAAGTGIGTMPTGAVTAPGGVPGSIVGAAIDPSFGFAVKPLGDRAAGGASAAALDLGGLFRYAGSTSQFLVEADSRFTNYNDFLSSDYFLDRLGYDPTRVQRRLGDGLYEQQLIANQLVTLVGAQRLTGYTDNQAQYRALLDAGATYARSYSLALGVGLSPAQMATLTSDIVLLVETTVQTPSGPQTVLAPRVYLTKAAQGNLTNGGAIIAGRDLSLRASDSLANAGVLRATATSGIAGGTIVNSGRLDLGSRGVVSAAQDLIDRGGSMTGGDLTLSAGRDLRLEPVAETRTVATRYYAGRSDQQVSLTTTTTNRGTDLVATGEVDLLAGRSLGVTGATVAAGGNLSLYGGEDVAVGSAVNTGTAFAIGREGRTQFKQTQIEQRNVLSDLRAGGDATIVTPGALTVSGGTVAAGGALVADAGSIGVTGMVDETRLQRDTLKKSGGLLSSTRTTTNYDGTDQSVVASTLSGDTVALRSSGDTRIAGSNVVADNGVDILAGGAIDVGTVAATDTEAQSTRVRKSGLSIGGGGLFLGVARNRNDVNSVAVTNTGSLIGSTTGDLTLDAGRDLSVTGSRVAGTGTTRLTGENVTIANATDVATTDTVSKSSSAGLSIKLYENTSGAIRSVGGLPGRVSSGSSGADGTAVTAASETLRSVTALTNAVTNTAGVSASLGASSSRSTTSGREEIAIGSSVTGRDVVVGADRDVAVRGSSTVADRDLSLYAGRDVTLESAQQRSETSFSNRSSGVGVGLNVGVGLVGGVNSGASVNVDRSRSSGSASSTAQANSLVEAGNRLAIVAGRDLALAGAVASGRDVAASAGRDLTVTSRQDVATSSQRSSGGSIGLTFSPSGVPGASGLGGNGSLDAGRGNSSSAMVGQQSALLARGGSLDATVGSTTRVDGGAVAALDAAGRDSGRLSLSTGDLVVTDIADSSRSRDMSIGVGASVNDPFRRPVAGANLPTVQGGFASSSLDQSTRGTIGQGAVAVASPSGTTALAAANRNVAASQVVISDRRSGFTVYADPAAARELGSLVNGDAQRSVILQGARQLVTDPTLPARQVVAEIQSLSDRLPESGAVDRLLGGFDRLIWGNDAVELSRINAEARDPRFAGLSAQQTYDARLEDRAAFIGRTEGAAGAQAFRDAVAASPELQRYLMTDAQALIAIRDGGTSIADPAQLIGLRLGGTPPSGAATSPVGPGDVVVTGDRKLGDKVAGALVGAQGYLNRLEEENATLKRIVEIGISLGKGPVGALGSYALDQAVDRVMRDTGLDQKAAQLTVWLGTNGLQILSSSDIVEEQALADRNPTEAATLTQAGVTILGVGSVASALHKAPNARVLVNNDRPGADGATDLPTGLAPPPTTGSGRRLEAGVASHDGSLPRIADGGAWLRGTAGNAGRVPAQIAEKLAGRSFSDFNQFRSEFWKAAASDPVLSGQFSPGNRALMAKGLAPIAPVSQQLGQRTRYELDHVQPVASGGNVYDLNNIIVRTPLNHLKGK